MCKGFAPSLTIWKDLGRAADSGDEKWASQFGMGEYGYRHDNMKTVHFEVGSIRDAFLSLNTAKETKMSSAGSQQERDDSPMKRSRIRLRVR